MAWRIRPLVSVMLVLLYHNVLSAPASGLPVAGNQVTIETFRRHIEKFRSRLLHPVEVHEQLLRGRTPRGVLITFDDGASGIVEAGRVLAEVGTPGVAFICPGALTTGLWFYRLADSIVRATVEHLNWRNTQLLLSQPKEKREAYALISKQLFDWPPGLRNEALFEIEAAAELSASQTHPALKTIDETGVRHAAETRGLVFANHSWSHPNLTKLSKAELAHEVEGAHSWLESSGLPVVPWFAFPRGEYNSSVTALVKRFCPVSFGANARENESGILPRTYLRDADSNPIRLGAKTAWEGRLRRSLYYR
jgi:peptidoglycan/xylan/chitin deacetylase (PgdA/CDA1 family)